MNRLWAWLFAVLLWAGIFLPELGALELRGEEGRRVRPGVEMLESGNWILPYLSGQPYLNKPPGINWLTGASIGLVGERSEFAARLPSPVFVLLFLSVVILVPNRAMELPDRLLLALLYLTTLSTVDKGRQIEIEAVYVAQIGLAAYWWLRGYQGNYSPWSTWLGSGIFLALAMLTKGPLFGVVIFYVMVFCVLLARRELKTALSLSHICGVVVWMGPFLLWLWLAARQVPASEIASTYGQQAGIVIFGPEFEWEGRWKAIQKSAAMLLPWGILAPLLWSRAILAGMPPERAAVLRGVRNAGLACIVGVILIPGSVARYSMPAVPLMCMALAWALPVDDRLKPGKDARRLLMVLSAAVPIVTIGLGLYAGFNTKVLALLVLVAGAALVFATGRIALNNSVRAVGSLSVVMMLAAMNWAIFTPMLRAGTETRRIWGHAVNEQVPPGATVYAYDPGNQIFLFYVREPLDFIVRPEQVDARVNYLLVGDAEYLRDGLEEQLRGRRKTEMLRFSYRNEKDFRLLSLE